MTKIHDDDSEDQWRERTHQIASLPLLDLIHALERRDEVAVWDMYRNTKDQARLLDWLASWSSIRTSKRKHPRDPSRTAVWVQFLFAIPFVTHAADDSQSNVLSLAGIEAALRTWFGSGQDINLDAVATKYTDIAHWSPLTQKERLARFGGVEYAHPALCVRPMHVVDRDLPDLQFVIGSVESWLAYPVFPDGEAPVREAQLQQSLSFELGAAGPGHTRQVGSLAPFADAMRAGLALWIDALGSQGIVRSWSIEPVDLDIVLLELHGDDDRFWRVPIRLHQIGLHGIDLIIEQLNREIGAPTASNRQRQ